MTDQDTTQAPPAEQVLEQGPPVTHPGAFLLALFAGLAAGGASGS